MRIVKKPQTPEELFMGVLRMTSEEAREFLRIIWRDIVETHLPDNPDGVLFMCSMFEEFLAQAIQFDDQIIWEDFDEDDIPPPSERH